MTNSLLVGRVQSPRCRPTMSPFTNVPGLTYDLCGHGSPTRLGRMRPMRIQVGRVPSLTTCACRVWCLTGWLLVLCWWARCGENCDDLGVCDDPVFSGGDMTAHANSSINSIHPPSRPPDIE